MARIYCSHCGKMVAQNSNFCPYCGAAQHGSEAALYNHAQETTAGKFLVSEAIKPADPNDQLLKQYPLAKTKVKKQHVAPGAKVGFIITYIGKTWLILLILLIVSFIEPLMGITGLVAYSAVLVLIALLAWSHFYYSVDDTSFRKYYGIFHKYDVTIPFNQIQNVNISRSLVDQILGLARIDIETAGNSKSDKKDVIGGSLSRAEGHLPGVTLEQAKKLHDILLQKAAVANK